MIWLRRISAVAPVVMAAGIFLGLLFPRLAGLAGPLLAPAVILILALALVRLEGRDLTARLRRPWVIAALVAWQLFGSAVMVWLVTMPLGALGMTPGLRSALVLLAAASPIMSSITLALLFRLDAALVSVVVFVSTLLVPVTIGPVAVLLMGEAARLDVWEMMWRLAVIVAGALVLAALLRTFMAREQINRRGAELDGIAVILLLVFALAIMEQAALTLRADTALFMIVLGASLALNLLLQAATWLLFRWLGAVEAVSAGMTAGNRNAGLALAGLPATAPVEVGLIFALSQVPIYVLPLVLRPLYRRLAGTG